MVIKIRIEKEIFFIGVIIVVVFIASQYVQIPIEKIPEIEQKEIPIKESSTSTIEKSKVVINVPAVDSQGNGVTTNLKVEAIPGEGRILTNINQLLFWVDTQQSIQIAKFVAENITKVNLSNVDLIYTIETDAQLIEGSSAGAALALATIAAIENKNLNSSVVITGTINSDGSVGPVGGILAKAKASKDSGAELFLVPKGQGIQTNYKAIRQCEQVGFFNYCSVLYEPERVGITQEAGIEVKEVTYIQEALKYFLT